MSKVKWVAIKVHEDTARQVQRLARKTRLPINYLVQTWADLAAAELRRARAAAKGGAA